MSEQEPKIINPETKESISARIERLKASLEKQKESPTVSERYIEKIEEIIIESEARLKELE